MSNTLTPFNIDSLLKIQNSSGINPEVQQHMAKITSYYTDTARPSEETISDNDFYSYTKRHNVCGPNNIVFGGNSKNNSVFHKGK